MRSLKLLLAYDGTSYCGWQVQARDPSIQAALERALKAVTGEETRATASGRTDAGVHALGQVVSLATKSQHTVAVLQRALNANLPDDIRVLQVTEALSGFHAIRDAVSKRYRYVIQDGGVPDVFARRYCWHLPTKLDDEAMGMAASRLVGKHDFASFQAAGSERATTVRTIHEFTVGRRRSPLAEQTVIEVSADGFLYNMVRNLVGTLVDVGRGVQSPDWPVQVLAARDRKQAGATAPARGLFLVGVEY